MGAVDNTQCDSGAQAGVLFEEQRWVVSPHGVGVWLSSEGSCMLWLLPAYVGGTYSHPAQLVAVYTGCGNLSKGCWE